MAKKPAALETFTVTYSAPFEAENAPVGVVTLDGALNLAIVSAVPAYADKLDLAVEMLNSSDAFVLNAPPPDDTPTRMQYRRTVERNAEGARDALMKVLRTKHGLTLTPG